MSGERVWFHKMSDEGFRKILPPPGPGVSGDRSFAGTSEPGLHQRSGLIERLEMMRDLVQLGAADALNPIRRRPRHIATGTRLKLSSKMHSSLAAGVQGDRPFLVSVEGRNPRFPKPEDGN